MKNLLILMLSILLIGCTAVANYPIHRINEQISTAGNDCLDHGGVDTYKVWVNDVRPQDGPIVGVTCRDEKYFEISRKDD